MRLRRSDPSAPGIRRRRQGRGFSYVGTDGARITDETTIARIRALAIPPAWTGVWICPWPNGHIQATGVDAAGRRQYRYHDGWRVQRDAAKHDRVMRLAAALPSARSRASADLSLSGLPVDRVMACAFRMLDLGSFRIGSEVYAQEHGTFGLATLRRDDVRVIDAVVECRFLAKGAKELVTSVEDAALAHVVADLLARDDPSPELLAWWSSEREAWQDVHARDINAYLRGLLGGPCSAKDFRTWNATVLMAAALAEAGSPPASERQRRRVVMTCLRAVAEHLGNTPAVARTSYVDHRIIDLWLSGEPLPLRAGLSANTLDRRVAALLSSNTPDLTDSSSVGNRSAITARMAG